MADAEQRHHRAPRLIIFDSGLGGLTVLRALREAVPEAAVSYLADDAGFPYGALAPDRLAERVTGLLGGAIAALSPDAVVIACNTASTVVLPLLRARHALPFIGTVPAIKPAAALSRSGLVSVLATPGTVSRDYTRALIANHGGGCRLTLVGSQRLATFAEQVMTRQAVAYADIHDEIAPCFVAEGDRRTDVVVLACTHYPLLLDRLESLAPWPVTWLDPAPAIARRTANMLAELGFAVGVGAQRPRGRIHFSSGNGGPAALGTVLDAFGLDAVTEPPAVPLPESA